MPQRPIFISSHKKCFFHFQSVEIGFFCEAATETRYRKLAKIPDINSRHPGDTHISSRFVAQALEVFFLNFAQDPADFAGKKGDSAPPGREREFSCAVISCGSQIGRN
jgi:hypothetical protein